MSLNKLQIRRDSLADFQAGNVSGVLAEPLFMTDEWRLRFGITDPGTAHPGVLEPPVPLREGIQAQTLWATGRYGTTPGIQVPATIAGAQIAGYFALSGSIGHYALLDGALARVHAVGDYKAGSADPRMYFAFALGNDTAGPTVIKPKGGAIVGVTSLPENGIEISILTVGENCLGFPDWITWELDANVAFFGYDGTGQFARSGNPNATMRVTGTLRWGPMLTGRGGFSGSPGPIWGGVNDSWQPNRSAPYAKGAIVSHHGIPYMSLWNIPVEPLSGWDTTAFQTAIAETEPGAGKFWRHHWLRLDNEIRFCFEEQVDLRASGKTLSLLVGGPRQTPRATTYPAHTTAAGSYSIVSTPESTGMAVASGNTYVARFDHSRPSSPVPGGTAGDEWDRYWRILGAERRDEMIIRSSTAFLVGGRAGVGDFTLT